MWALLARLFNFGPVQCVVSELKFCTVRCVGSDLNITVACGIGPWAPGGCVCRHSGEEMPHTWDIEEIPHEAGDGVSR